MRRTNVEAVQHLAQRRAGGGHQFGVEGVAHGDAHGGKALLRKDVHGGLDSLGLTTHDTLVVGVDVGGHHIAIHLLEHILDDGIRGHDSGHPAIVAQRHLGHLCAACGRGFKRLRKGHNARGNQRGVLAQRVTHGHVGRKAIITQQQQHGGIQRQHGRLGNRRLHQVLLHLLDGGGIGAVNKDVGGERAAQNGGHHAVGFGKDTRHRGRQRSQFAAHVGILAALAGEKEGNLARARSAAAEDALALQRLPCLRVVKAGRLARLA